MIEAVEVLKVKSLEHLDHLDHLDHLQFYLNVIPKIIGTYVARSPGVPTLM